MPEAKRRPRARRAARRRLCAAAVLLMLATTAVRAAAAPVPSPAPAAGCGTPAQCFARMAEAQRDVKSIRARFKQTKHVAMLAGPLVSAGRFSFARPDRVRWEMETPEPLVVEVAGASLRAGPPGAVKDVEAGPAVGLFRDLAGIFSGATGYAGQRFDLGPGTGPQSFVLTPRDPSVGRVIRSIAIELDPATGGPRRVAITETGGDATEIELLDVVVERTDAGSAS